jgi:hypothetical protein
MTRRIEGKKVVLALLLVIAGVLTFAFYRYYTIEPGEGVWGQLGVQGTEHAGFQAPFWASAPAASD